MKKLFILPVMAAAMLLGACTEEKETALNIEDIQGTTTVTGRIYYDAGTALEGESNIIRILTPVGGKTVYFYLDYSSVDSNYDGKRVYSTVTSTSGQFEIELPSNNNGFDYSMSVESFQASRSEYDLANEEYVRASCYFTNIEVLNLTAFENIALYEEVILDDYTEINNF